MKTKPDNALPDVPKWVSPLNLAARFLAGSALIFAGFAKAVGPTGAMASLIMAYKIVPISLALQIGSVLPWFELYVGLFLLTGFYLPWAKKLAAGLFGIFALVLLSALFRGIDLSSCGCFGDGLALSPIQTLMFDLIALGLLVAAIKFPSSQLSVDQWVEGTNNKKLKGAKG